jgi:hypothetical protein
VAFKAFLELAIEVDGALQEKHKRSWLLFQLSGCVGTHPFVRIMKKCLYNASDQALDELILQLDGIRRTHLPMSRFIVGLDEAQWAETLYRSVFLSSTSPTGTKFQSILHEMVAVFSQLPGVKLVVSGTGVSLEEIEDAIASGGSKRTAVQLFHELGMFDTWPKLQLFLKRYIPASILESPSGMRLQQRILEYLLGR